MLLMYGDINITEILKIHHHSYDTYSLDFKDNKNVKKYKDKLENSECDINILKDSKKYCITVEEVCNNEIIFYWKDEDPFVISKEEYLNNTRYKKDIDFSKAEEELKFPLHEDLKKFFRKSNFCHMYGGLSENQIPSTEKWGKWFEEDVVITLFGMDVGDNFERFIKSKFEEWTGGNDFGHRVWIGDLVDNRGNMLIVFNNDNGNVEWIDSEYGNFGNLEEDPNGILCTNIHNFIEML